jgi:hypothetical protein
MISIINTAASIPNNILKLSNRKPNQSKTAIVLLRMAKDRLQMQSLTFKCCAQCAPAINEAIIKPYTLKTFSVSPRIGMIFTPLIKHVAQKMNGSVPA